MTLAYIALACVMAGLFSVLFLVVLPFMKRDPDYKPGQDHPPDESIYDVF